MSQKTRTLSKRASQDGQARAEFLTSAYTSTLDVLTQGVRQVVALGLVLMDTKAWGKVSGEIPHGQFQSWLGENCRSVPYRTAARWMQAAKSAAAALEITPGEKVASLALHEILSTDAAKLPRQAAKVQARFLDLVEGKGQRDLVLEFRSATPTKRVHGPRGQMSPEEELASEIRTSTELVKAFCTTGYTLLEDRTLLKVTPELRRELASVCVRLGQKLRGRAKAAQ